MSYDSDRVRLPDLLDTVDGPTGLTIAEILRAKHGRRPPSLQIGRADYTDLDAHWAQQDADPEQTRERLGAIVPGLLG